MNTPITEDWLRETGFKWSQEERQPHRHWLLWIGAAQRETRGFQPTRCADDMGLEISKWDDAGTRWGLWLRADYAGRYDRFLYGREVAYLEQVTRLIEALTDQPWDPANVLYGQYWTPDAAEWLRKDRERADWRMAEQRSRARGEDDTAADPKATGR